MDVHPAVLAQAFAVLPPHQLEAIADHHAARMLAHDRARAEQAREQPINQDQDQDQEERQEERQEAGPARPRRNRRQARAPKAYWVRRDLTVEQRAQSSDYYVLLQPNMEGADAQGQKVFHNYTRISAEAFLMILEQVGPRIAKANTNYRESLSPGLKLACTLRYLASGDSYHSLGYAFNVGFNTISNFVPEVCAALYECFEEEAFPEMHHADKWREIAQRFQDKWNMPHCMGALDGKHVRIKKPPNTGTLYFNYKRYFSVPMLALVDADYNFLWIELGGQGHMSDAQIFLQSDLFFGLENNRIDRPPPCPLTDDPADTENVPFFIVADDAFALKDYCIKPYSRRHMTPRERVFNYRVSRARRVVENAFGILAMRFRFLLRALETKLANSLLCIRASVVLHNIINRREPQPAGMADRDGVDGVVVPGGWRDLVRWPDNPQGPQRLGRVGAAGTVVRESLADYFGTPRGEIPWQWRMAQVQPPPPANVPEGE